MLVFIFCPVLNLATLLSLDRCPPPRGPRARLRRKGRGRGGGAPVQGHSGFSPRYQGWGLIDAGGAGPGIGRRVGAIFCTFWTRLGGDLLPPQVDLCKWRRVRDTRMFRVGLICDFEAISTIKGLASARINRFKNTLRRSDPRGVPRESRC